MKKFEESMRKVWAVIVSFCAGVGAWCMICFANIRDWYNRRHCHNRPIDDEFIGVSTGSEGPVITFIPQRTTRVRVHNHRVIPAFVIFIIIIWADKNGLFKDYAGLQAFVDMALYVVDQFYQFGMKMIESLVSHFNVPSLWENFQNWFWANWFF